MLGWVPLKAHGILMNGTPTNHGAGGMVIFSARSGTIRSSYPLCAGDRHHIAV